MKPTVLAVVVVVVGLSLCFNSAEAWNRTRCGPGDLVTQWGAQVDPSNVWPEYPRPQLVRPDESWQNLNGLWEFQPTDEASLLSPPFGTTLNMTILVPFPVESCLSGIGQNFKYLWYRLEFEVNEDAPITTINFGAVDWQTTVFVNGKTVGNHTGGYDSFVFDITSFLQNGTNELFVAVYDPSDEGFQPNGKQRISAITNPGGDTYTPSSGIWQTVWLEFLPSVYIEKLTILTDTRTLTISAQITDSTSNVTFTVFDDDVVVVSATTTAGTTIEIEIPEPKLWDPTSPYLYNLTVDIPSGDKVQSYFGMRSITLGTVEHPGTPEVTNVGIDRPGGDLPGFPVTLPEANYTLCYEMCFNTPGCFAWAYGDPNCTSPGLGPQCWNKGRLYGGEVENNCRVSGIMATPPYRAVRPFINGGFIFLAGILDQSFWPDGLYSPPSDEAILFDLVTVKSFGLNTIRLHQKVNPERYYYYADKLGIVILQDMIQKYGGATAETVAPFMLDLERMITGKYNHPCIVQWETFNEEDCVAQFNATAVVEYVQSLDPSRLVDTDSGGPANNLHVGDVNDLHTYPYPGDPIPSSHQYGMLGEYGGIGAFVTGHEWVPNGCYAYLPMNSTHTQAVVYQGMLQSILAMKNDISVAILTQVTDLEEECDGLLTYDRISKFSQDDFEAIVSATQKLINSWPPY